MTLSAEVGIHLEIPNEIPVPQGACSEPGQLARLTRLPAESGTQRCWGGAVAYGVGGDLGLIDRSAQRAELPACVDAVR